MAQYILKDAIKAEVEANLNIANNGISYAQSGIKRGLDEYKSVLNTWQHCQNVCKNILAYIDTLEVKKFND